jgi:hypothetical protein
MLHDFRFMVLAVVFHGHPFQQFDGSIYFWLTFWQNSGFVCVTHDTTSMVPPAPALAEFPGNPARATHKMKPSLLPSGFFWLPCLTVVIFITLAAQFIFG